MKDIDRPIPRREEDGGFISRSHKDLTLASKEDRDEYLYNRFMSVWRPCQPKVYWLEIKPANDGVTWDWEGMRDGA